MSDTIRALRAREFPWAVSRNHIFLNHASTGPLPQRAVDALQEATALRAEPWRFTFEMQFGTLAKARAACARLVGAEPREIALMVNTSYGLNLAARALPFEPGDVVITSDREYPSNVYPWMELEVARGVKLERVPCTGALPDEGAILAALDRPRVRGLVLSWVSFASGFRIDVERLGRVCRERGIWFVLDAIQGVGAAPLDVSKLPVDVVACGGQKWLLSPWGTGFTYVHPEIMERITPQPVSWMGVRGSDDFSSLVDYDLTWRADARRFEQITLPFQDFAGMAASLGLLRELGAESVAAHVAARVRQLRHGAESAGIPVVTPPGRMAGIVSVRPRDPRAASARLRDKKVVHSVREETLRLAPHCYSTSTEIELVLEALAG